MYVSKRNLFFKSKDSGYLLFCGNTNSFFQIDDDNVPLVKKMFDTGDDSGLPEDIKKAFVKAGVILPESDEERFKRLKYLSYLTRFDPTSMSITVAPTMACNFKCVYCYEGDRVQNVTMNTEVIDGLITFIKKRNCKNITLVWYGGEPLCAFDKIIEFNQKLKEVNIPNLQQNMVTNGSLLDEEKIDLLFKYKINNLQITLDGDEKLHNEHRPMKNGANSYQSVIKGLDRVFEYYKKTGNRLNVAIRVNTDKKNVDMFHKIYEEMTQKYSGFFYVYPAFINKNSERDCHSESCLSTHESAEFILNLAKNYSIQTTEFYPLKNKLICCDVNKVHTYVVSSNGDIFRCWEDINVEERKIGNVLTGVNDKNNIIQENVMESSGFEDEVCKDCLFLYSCMGGCPKKRLQNRVLNKELNPVCLSIKYNPEEYLETYFKYKTEKL